MFYNNCYLRALLKAIAKALIVSLVVELDFLEMSDIPSKLELGC